MTTRVRTLLAVLALGAALPAAAQDTGVPAAPGTPTPAPIVDLPEAPDRIDAGAYLAARVAGSADDYAAAARWFHAARDADPANPALMEGDLIARVAAGDLEGAIPVARTLAGINPAVPSAQIVLVTDEARRGDYAGLLAAMKAGRSVNPLMDKLVVAWAELGLGDMSVAQQRFDEIAATPGLEAFGRYHKALALASVGDFEGAEAILSAKDKGALGFLRRATVAHAEILSQLERNPEAAKALRAAFPAGSDPAIDAMVVRLQSGETLPFDIARNVTDGMAEVFFTLALALNDGSADAFTLVSARAAAYLRPDHTDAVLLAAGVLDRQKQWDLAVAAYAAIPASDPGHFAATLGRAQALQAAGRPDEAATALTGLAQANPDLLGVQLALGDLERSRDKWAEAEAAYDRAVALAPAKDPAYWSVWYSRAVARERQGKWPGAEGDFRQALALDPGQPQVLNYLGYSYLERNENLEEALGMIRRAAAAQPDSGYIIDSLAWGLFRLGRYDEAVEPMEKASLLEPVDPVVTDHLGDVYWAVGRAREAEFQWRRALSFDPEEKDAARIRAKLEKGLDAVRAGEGAPPLDAAKAPAPAPAADAPAPPPAPVPDAPGTNN